MKRNGIGQLRVNGRESLDLPARRGERHFNGRSEVARKIEQSIAYMSQHLNQPLHVANLAAAVNISPSHYSALFKRVTGSPPIDFFIRLRMQQACRLFDSTPLNVREVATALGYDDPFYFSRLFKSIYRLAPNGYRQKRAGKPAAGSNGANLGLPSGNQIIQCSNMSIFKQNQPTKIP